MSIRVSVDVTKSGPIAAGRIGGLLDALERDIRVAVADQAAAEVGRETIVFKQPTGNYLRNITTTNRVDTTRVHNDDVIYGAWLEGTSRRNDETRFKGYRLFRKAAQAVEGRVDEIAWPQVRRFINRVNG